MKNEAVAPGQARAVIRCTPENAGEMRALVQRWPELNDLVKGLQAQGLRVRTAQALSCGVAGLALGQAWVTAQQLAQAQQSMDSEETAACA